MKLIRLRKERQLHFGNTHVDFQIIVVGLIFFLTTSWPINFNFPLIFKLSWKKKERSTSMNSSTTHSIDNQASLMQTSFVPLSFAQTSLTPTRRKQLFFSLRPTRAQARLSNEFSSLPLVRYGDLFSGLTSRLSKLFPSIQWKPRFHGQKRESVVRSSLINFDGNFFFLSVLRNKGLLNLWDAKY